MQCYRSSGLGFHGFTLYATRRFEEGIQLGDATTLKDLAGIECARKTGLAWTIV